MKARWDCAVIDERCVLYEGAVPTRAAQTKLARIRSRTEEDDGVALGTSQRGVTKVLEVPGVLRVPLPGM